MRILEKLCLVQHAEKTSTQISTMLSNECGNVWVLCYKRQCEEVLGSFHDLKQFLYASSFYEGCFVIFLLVLLCTLVVTQKEVVGIDKISKL